MVTSIIRVVHSTGYEYATGAQASFNEVRMIPLATSAQYPLSSSLEITPTAWQLPYTDYWGSEVVAFEINQRHDELRIIASSVVHVDRPARVGRSDRLCWDELPTDGVADRYCEFLTIAPSVKPPASMVKWLTRLRRTAETPAAFARALGAGLRERIRYVPGSTGVHTTAMDAWEGGAGVCQDIAHLMLGGLRWAEIPGRYVSGYLIPGFDAAVGVPQSAESHAWVQFWDGEWVGHDPTNDVCPDERYVEVAYGRDYFDAAPLVGVFKGGEESRMFVDVELTRLQ